MITVKQFIEHQNDPQWNLENPHLSNLQDNEVVFIDDVPYVKTQLIFEGSENPKKAAKISDLEAKNMQLELELIQLRLENETAKYRNESLQNLVYNLQRELDLFRDTNKQYVSEEEKLGLKYINLKTEHQELLVKIEKLVAAKKAMHIQITNLVAKNKKLRKVAGLFHEFDYGVKKLFALFDKGKGDSFKEDIDELL